MNNSFSLDDLRAEVEREFEPLKLTIGEEELVLRNPLRMPQKDREVLSQAFEELDRLTGLATEYQKVSEAAEKDESVEVPEIDSRKLEADILVATKNVLKAAVGSKGGTRLFTSLGDDLQLAQKVLLVWAEKVKPGEASSSED